MPSRRSALPIGHYVVMPEDAPGPSGAPVPLPDYLRERVQMFPETHMGAQTITVTLGDGRVMKGLDVAWGTEVVRVGGEYGIPFSGDDIVAVEDASGTT